MRRRVAPAFFGAFGVGSGIGMANPKPEGRRPKEGRNPKSEAYELRSWSAAASKAFLGAELPSRGGPGRLASGQATWWLSSDFGFRPSFGLRPSSFGFQELCLSHEQDSQSV